MKFKFDSNTLGGMLLHLILAGLLLMVLCILYFYAYLPGKTNHGESITVPNIEGLALDKVAEFLKDHDLRYEINDSSYSDDYPPLTVLKQVPAAGAKVKENRKIYVTVNQINPPTVPMPDLTDASLTNAEALLKGSELKKGRIELVRGPFLNVVKDMKVAGKSVAPGARVPKGTVIDLVIMDGGSGSVNTPNVVGESLEDAKVLLLGMYLSLGKVEVVGDTTGGGAIVLKQNPQAPENIRVGDVVDLWIGLPGAQIEDEADLSDDNEDGQ